VIFHAYAATPPCNGAIVLNFGMKGVIADVITHANFLSIGSGVWEF